ncbi:hypothetical protein GOP47_0017829 [Adiantum capillus-veneris]|uniref:Uncharacterized protein n=1 Tax=Adiantum capillus-veneris TaxID=13818 RepID=A0A9D4ZC63_ADICA|nr:hypothetical protein GOP47_0017829 [Adiantum capillus-veneris]
MGWAKFEGGAGLQRIRTSTEAPSEDQDYSSTAWETSILQSADVLARAAASLEALEARRKSHWVPRGVEVSSTQATPIKLLGVAGQWMFHH